MLIPREKWKQEILKENSSCSRKVIATPKINPEANTAVYVLFKSLHVVKIESPSTDVTSADASFLEAH